MLLKEISLLTFFGAFSGQLEDKTSCTPVNVQTRNVPASNISTNLCDRKESETIPAKGRNYPVPQRRLSVLEHRNEVIRLIQEYRIVCIEGEAGCGKSTMIPQFILDSSTDYCKIIVCQPRRVSAINLARHVACQRSQKCGSAVGYCIGDEKNVIPGTSIVYCTTGFLLQVS